MNLLWLIVYIFMKSVAVIRFCRVDFDSLLSNQFSEQPVSASWSQPNYVKVQWRTINQLLNAAGSMICELPSRQWYTHTWINRCYLPPINRCDLPPINGCYLPPINGCYLPPINGCYLPPINRCCLPPINGCYLPPINGCYLPPINGCDLPPINGCFTSFISYHN